MIHPPRLKKGDTIGVIAPAGPPDRTRLQKAISFFLNMGLCVQLGKHIDKRNGYLAGTDSERLEDLQDMITNPAIKAIVFARGGYGCARITPYIDFACIKKQPKIFWGYSDITYLHTAIRQRTGLITFHGPMLASDIGNDDFDYLSARMFEQLFQPTTYTYTEEISPLHVIAEGNANGELVGGNLSLLVSSLGTPFEIDTTNRLLLLEDIGEEPYRIDSMLNQLKLAGKLETAAGIILGDFADAKPKVTPSLPLDKVFDDYFRKLDIPVISGFKIGHCMPHIAIPLGVEACLSSYDKKLIAKPGVQ
ncbi:MAG: S66 peptidase family protein [Bacillota bacterium]|uniref:LD-carboxypeptidase n=1 Tax=Virgibacillus salarius TaxID=447199 RepID=A0A941DUM0_9BACI|nr:MULTISPECIES: LD-carboxypeptidase [Bacillaceae]NAZ08370.1 LD-carboxypeptidase [Agaribacter marinus]MBR7795657.1 LD-carboxypeptidase [Virgibacillus salarius]MCC2252532.1 LD-carboxypeptidase [Virgibacillus sp. AGTR]MDY7046557.1 LD-carboxypeptidase [Virgibacillus sp. M23]QRZ18511.1 LD-carboxypeptidase [Virgibacillus sp. AGTR]